MTDVEAKTDPLVNIRERIKGKKRELDQIDARRNESLLKGNKMLWYITMKDHCGNRTYYGRRAMNLYFTNHIEDAVVFANLEDALFVTANMGWDMNAVKPYMVYRP